MQHFVISLHVYLVPSTCVFNVKRECFSNLPTFYMYNVHLRSSENAIAIHHPSTRASIVSRIQGRMMYQFVISLHLHLVSSENASSSAPSAQSHKRVLAFRHPSTVLRRIGLIKLRSFSITEQILGQSLSTLQTLKLLGSFFSSSAQMASDPLQESCSIELVTRAGIYLALS